MKKISLLIILLNSIYVNAQLYIGPEVGTNLITMRNKDIGKEFNLGWHGGIRTSYFFSDYFSLTGGVYFTEKRQAYSSLDTAAVEVFGFSLEDLIPGINLDQYTSTIGSVSQYYIQIPIMASYKLDNFSLSAGPFVGFMIRAWSREESSTDVPFLKVIDMSTIDSTGFLTALLPPAESTTFTETSSKSNLRIFDYGFKAGLSYQVNSLGFNLSYLFSLTDYRIDRGDLDLQRHHYFQFSINYDFGWTGNLGNSRY